MANETLITESVTQVSEIFRSIYSKLLVATIILLVGFIIGKLIGKIIEKILHELELNSIVKKAAKIDLALEQIIATGTTYFVYFITIIMTLNQLDITTTVLQMLSGAVIVIIIISIVLAIKDFVPNAFAGFFIHRNKFLQEGETIIVKGMEGKVIHVDLIETKLETKEGDIVYIPNSALTKTEVIKVRDNKNKRKAKKTKLR